MSLRIPYPPCVSGLSSDGDICDTGYKSVWPNTLGMDGKQAKKIIEKDNPLVTGVIISPGFYVSHDFCCNRVWVFVDEHHKVSVVPKVG
ncbi:ase inhibitor-like [Olea europaea subsp. europaea]|uniref:Ase inhibitor-like n=1 Tax=Olea europaea subsp. europaea TaxID=158383 RepID=A0A8S0STC4_OLEEU|nr:ase inhibitor-like [Olea europaea subsp. europaea]